MIESEVRKFYKLLNHDGLWSQLHCQDVVNKKIVDRRLVSGEQQVVNWARQFDGKGNCFIGRNPRNKDGTVAKITCVSLDLDPVREGMVASWEQVTECAKCALEIADAFGFPFVAFTGNGHMLLQTVMRTDWNIKDSETWLNKLQDEVNEKLPKTIHADDIHDAPRLIKLIGTHSMKGERRPTYTVRISAPSVDLFNKVLPIVPSNPEPADNSAEVLLSKSPYKSRSEGVFALAVHSRKAGLSREECAKLLKENPYGRDESAKDIGRIIEKVYGAGVCTITDSHSKPIMVHSPKDKQSVDDYRESLSNTKPVPELLTGFRPLDESTFGIKRGELYMVSARPKVGKTSLICSIALNLCRAGKSVNLLTTEMTYKDVWNRMFSIDLNIDNRRFQDGQFTDEERTKLNCLLSEFDKYPLNICDSFQPDINSVKQMVEAYPCDVLIFDHIQHINSGDDPHILSEFTRGLKELTMDKKFATIVVSQLKRPAQIFSFKSEVVHEAPPTMSDLKGSGTLEQEASVIIALWNKKGSEVDDMRIVNVDILANRYGSTKQFEMMFIPSRTRFEVA